MTPFIPIPQHNYPDNSPPGFYRRGLNSAGTQNSLKTIPLFLHVTAREAHDITERDYDDMLYVCVSSCLCLGLLMCSFDRREFAFDELD
jgi:hypothetical protein